MTGSTPGSGTSTTPRVGRAVVARSGVDGSPKDREHNPARHEIHLRIEPARVFKWLAVAIAFLVAINTATRVWLWAIDYQVRDGIRALCLVVDLDYEKSVPTWYASLALLGCAGLLAVAAAAKRRQRERFAGHWALLSAVFVVLSIDESAAVHEIFATPLRRYLNTDGLLFYAWIIPAFFAVCVFGLFYLRFLFHLPRRTKMLFLLAGGVFVGGSLGIESISGLFVGATQGESLPYLLASTFEETCEMLGIAIFIYALLDYLAPRVEFIGAEIAGPLSEGR